MAVFIFLYDFPGFRVYHLTTRKGHALTLIVLCFRNQDIARLINHSDLVHRFNVVPQSMHLLQEFIHIFDHKRIVINENVCIWLLRLVIMVHSLHFIKDLWCMLLHLRCSILCILGQSILLIPFVGTTDSCKLFVYFESSSYAEFTNRVFGCGRVDISI